jgi:Glycosyltransferase WbsX
MRMPTSFLRCLFLSLLSGVCVAQCTKGACAPEYNIGVYYFPGWHNGVWPRIIKDQPWDEIKPYPERRPLLGWYDDGDDAVVSRQLTWMKQYGVTFVVYDWYWINLNNGVVLEEPIKAHLRSNAGASMDFAILWANHFNVPSSMNQFDQVVRYWIQNYFSHANYYRIKGLPVVYMFDPNALDQDAIKFHSSGKELLDRAQKIAKSSGYRGIYFVACSQAVARDVKKTSDVGYSAISTYNYHFGLSGVWDHRRSSWSYDELQSGYSETWAWMVKNSELPYMIPVTSGWDKRPLGGSPDPKHDNSTSTPATFREHLLRAKEIVDKYPQKTMKTVMVCCWNEFGEGSYVEPTDKYGFEYLKQIQDVFKGGTVSK